MTGWFKLWRYLFKKPIWMNSNPEQKTVLITIMGMVNYESNQWEWKGQKFDLKPGQVITSIPKIQQMAGQGISQQNVRSSIARFKKLEFLTNESTNAGRLITIINWEIYQGDDPDVNRVINRWTTGSQQAANRRPTDQPTPIKEKNKNIKNIKNIKKEKPPKTFYREFVSLTGEEYQTLIDKFGGDMTAKMMDILDNYKGSKGKEYKSDYRAILSWVVDKVQKEYIASAQILDEVEKDTRTPEEQKAGMEKFRQFASATANKLKGVD